MTKTATPPRTRGDGTRRALLATARAAFAKDGFDAARTAEIAARTGVAEGTLFLHFDSKLGLLCAVMDEVYVGLIADAQAIAAAPATSPRATLKAMLANYLDHLYRDWAIIREFAHQGRYGRSGDNMAVDRFAACNRAFLETYEPVLVAIIAGGGLPAGTSSRLLRTIIFGALEHAAVAAWRRADENSEPRIEHLGAGTLDAILDHVLAPPAVTPESETLTRIEAKLDAALANANGDARNSL